MGIIMRDYVLSYKTELPICECIQNIIKQPWQYACSWGNSLWYTCEKISDTRLLITFTGGQFRKAMRTQFWVDFAYEQGKTIVTMRFNKELFGLPAMTPPSDIDSFMKQRINAIRQ